MAIVHYGILVIPEAHEMAINFYLAMINNEPFIFDGQPNRNLSVPCNPGGIWGNPITHRLGGRYYTDELLTFYQVDRLKVDGVLQAPEGGWPLVFAGEEVLTEAEAQAAIDELAMFVTTAEEYPQMGLTTLAAVMSAMNIARISEPEC
jgi:hypothetical protein